jgi:hypothetical protein
MAKALGHRRTDMHNSGADGTSRYEPTSIFESVPADGHHGCQLQEHGDFGTQENGHAEDKEQ